MKCRPNKTFDLPLNPTDRKLQSVVLPRDGEVVRALYVGHRFNHVMQMHTEHILGVGGCTTLSHKSATLSTFRESNPAGSFLRIAQVSGITELQVNTADGNTGANLFNKMTACSPVYNRFGVVLDRDTKQGKQGPQCIPIYSDNDTFFYSMFMCPQHVEVIPEEWFRLCSDSTRGVWCTQCTLEDVGAIRRRTLLWDTAVRCEISLIHLQAVC